MVGAVEPDEAPFVVDQGLDEHGASPDPVQVHEYVAGVVQAQRLAKEPVVQEQLAGMQGTAAARGLANPAGAAYQMLNLRISGQALAQSMRRLRQR